MIVPLPLGGISVYIISIPYMQNLEQKIFFFEILVIWKKYDTLYKLESKTHIL